MGEFVRSMNTRLKQLGRHKSYAVLDEYLELGEPFEAHPLSGVL
jgi:hypothetical protein